MLMCLVAFVKLLLLWLSLLPIAVVRSSHLLYATCSTYQLAPTTASRCLLAGLENIVFYWRKASSIQNK
ncbi:hypothetical protein RND81_09G069900 [Saponaria officinalis]|uniref:Secreted protein n=1 Tax=Saponaria officinalis TaxID=3572 RepID=A0AAW1IJN6_SAPOF